MQRKKIHKHGTGKYQMITTEMRKRVIELVVNFHLSIKQVKFIVLSNLTVKAAN